MPPSEEPTTPPTSPEPVATPPVTATDGDVPASTADAPSAGTEDQVKKEPEAPTIDNTDIESADTSTLVALVTNTSFDEISIEDAEAIIKSIVFEELTEEQTAQVVAALNEAPDEVKQAFEQEVNIYSGQFDEYVPAGSVVSVGQRRVVVAASAATMISAPAPTSRRKVK